MHNKLKRKKTKKKEDESRVARFMLRDGHKSVETEQGEQGDTQKKKKGHSNSCEKRECCFGFLPVVMLQISPLPVCL